MTEEKQSSSKSISSELESLMANPFSDTPTHPGIAVENNSEAKPASLYDQLPLESKKMADDLVGQINARNSQSVLLYGAPAQEKLHDFSQSMLQHVQSKDVGPIGDIITDLMHKIEEASPEELGTNSNAFSRFFSKMKRSINEITSKYQQMGTQIDRIAIKLDQSKKVLVEDNLFLDELYDKNKDYFQALNIYIAAGEQKIEDILTKELPTLQAEAEKSNDQMLVQDVNDLRQFATRLEKRVHDLKLSRQITIQSAPQIRLIQNTNQVLAEKIQSSIMTAIPLWKNQVAIALTLMRQQQAVKAQQQVSKTTNDLLKHNAELLKTNTIETAIENERGLVDIETLKETQGKLIETIKETLAIQEDGRQKRQSAEKELLQMETELKQHLLEMK
ncbi:MULTISPECIES: toxic anion resistance protein [Brochothrix]|uniref:Toxic anion resistance protein n=1 Tax=Brochothrix thermosphacta TaxID=2756 RepID=A0A1D2LUV1_BROTH|nr:MULTISPECIES: toxic anion resistance protein [Brochothrix]SLN05746.1 Tellurite resistance protein [Brachybacterium faecium]ANZ94493.1 tellurite resistance protein TelA [Brochothrix thermosphacta]ANZ97196.1 tellurite resistance protein TelA [Brochothrix thermosphacta]ATF26636.1 toxic anion resistance protein [Brochothrix thermosphacta]ATH85991.1 toxic anion resistance protein [Brochothrix thermosphacta]